MGSRQVGKWGSMQVGKWDNGNMGPGKFFPKPIDTRFRICYHGYNDGNRRRAGRAQAKEE